MEFLLFASNHVFCNECRCSVVVKFEIDLNILGDFSF